MQSEFEQTCREAFELFGITQADFTKAMTKLSHDNEVASEFRNITTDPNPQPVSWPAELTAEKLKEILEVEVELTTARAAVEETLTTEQVTMAMVEIEDEIFSRFAVEFDEKTAAYTHYSASMPEMKQLMRNLSEAQLKLQRKKK